MARRVGGSAAVAFEAEGATDLAPVEAVDPRDCLADVWGGKLVSLTAIQRSEGRGLARINVERLSEASAKALADEVSPADLAMVDLMRPKTFGECKREGWGSEVACPFVSCKYHLALEVTAPGAFRVYHPELEITELDHTCALVVAATAEKFEGTSPEELGRVFAMTETGVHLYLKRLLAAVLASPEGGHLADFLDDEPASVRGFGSSHRTPLALKGC